MADLSREKPSEPQVTQRRAQVEEVKVIQLVVFTAGEEEFCADIGQVREIIRTTTITPIPDSPDFIRGILNVRGEVVCVVDLKDRFFLRAEKGEAPKHIIISEQEKNLFGLLVDEVTEVLRIPVTEIKATPGLVTKIEEKYVAGVVTLENRLIIQLDLSKVLSEEELVKLSDVTRRHVRDLPGQPAGQKTKEGRKEKK